MRPLRLHTGFTPPIPVPAIARRTRRHRRPPREPGHGDRRGLMP